MLDLSDILDMYVGHSGVCWTCMHSFCDFMCIMDMYRRIKCGSYAMLLIYMWYSGLYADVWI
jgi:hypothetical protein